MKKLLLLLAAACCIASCAEIRTSYIGKAYPTTGTAPELYFDWKDVPSDYETMGSIKATPFGKTLEEAQALIERNLRPDLHDDRKDREKRRRQQNPNRHHIPERFHDQPASGDIHKV